MVKRLDLLFRHRHHCIMFCFKDSKICWYIIRGRNSKRNATRRASRILRRNHKSAIRSPHENSFDNCIFRLPGNFAFYCLVNYFSKITKKTLQVAEIDRSKKVFLSEKIFCKNLMFEKSVILSLPWKVMEKLWRRRARRRRVLFGLCGRALRRRLPQSPCILGHAALPRIPALIGDVRCEV